MPTKLLFALAFLSAAGLAACGNDSYDLSATPTPEPTASTATVEATYQTTPIPNLQINMYASSVDMSVTPNPSASATATPQAVPTGPILQTQTTASDGTATFTNLNPIGTYCWVFSYSAGGATLNAQECTNQWPYGQINLGT